MPDSSAPIAHLEAALAAGRADTAQLYELAGLKLAAGDAPGAITAYTRCLQGAASPAIYNNLGAALIQAGRYEEAAAALQSALALNPEYVRAWVNLGKAEREVGELARARVSLERALALSPDYVPALVNLGEVLAAAGNAPAAEAVLERAVRLEPRRAEAWSALGLARLQSGRTQQAVADLRRAVALAPDHADAHANLAHALFVSGDWSGAWPHFEYRARRHAHRGAFKPPAGMVRWDGEPCPDIELWLIGEQGLGDQIQFARYARLVTERGIRCVLACDPRLVRLLAPAGLASRIVPLADFPSLAASESSARWLPLMSAPAWHSTTPETVPHAAGYLVAERERVRAWETRLPRGMKRIALAWAGNPRMETGRYAGRSPPLAALEPLLAVPYCAFVSLQKGPGEEQLDTAPFGASIARLADLDSGSDAFLDTAAVLTCVDLLVTSDSGIAHLAGALGVPTWLCLMHAPDWRWMLDGTATPWYRSMRLFRQSSPGDWRSVYADVAATLAAAPPWRAPR
jgi:tetratricopeptide (TPR) repeat protein